MLNWWDAVIRSLGVCTFTGIITLTLKYKLKLMTFQGCAYWVKMSIVGVSNPNKPITHASEGSEVLGSPNIYPDPETGLDPLIFWKKCVMWASPFLAHCNR